MGLSKFMEGSQVHEEAQEQHPTVNLVVDVQYGGAESSMESQEKFLKKISDSVEKLRGQGIPTIWITMCDENKLHPATPPQAGGVAKTRSAAEMEKLGFLAHGGEADEEMIARYRDTLRQYGPKTDEAVFKKAFFNAFTEKEDVPRMKEHLLNQRRDSLDLGQVFQGETLRAHLEKMGVKQVTIMGGMADVCVMETAIGAATHGMKASILHDHTISRDDMDGDRPASFQERKIKDKLEKMTDRPQELARDPTHSAFAKDTLLSGVEKAAIKTGIQTRTLDAFIKQHNAPEVKADTTAKQRPPVLR